MSRFGTFSAMQHYSDLNQQAFTQFGDTIIVIRTRIELSNLVLNILIQRKLKMLIKIVQVSASK